MRFKLEPAKKLRDRGVQHKRIEQIDVIDQEETGARRIEARRPVDNKFGAREFHCDAAEHSLRTVVLARIDKNPQQYQAFLKRRGVAFETGRDPETDISSSYGTFQIPETYLIDRNGKVLEKVVSNQDWMDPQFLSRVKSMLNGD